MTPPLPGKLHVIAMYAQGGGLSGGDRIFLELSRRWAYQGQPLSIAVTQEGKAMCLRNGIDPSLVTEWPLEPAPRNRLSHYLRLTVHSLRRALPSGSIPRESIVYSASDFWPDALAATAAKLRYRASWIAGFYMFAPPPHKGFEGGWRTGIPRAIDAFYWLSQRLSLPLIIRFADAILVTGEHDRDRLCRYGVPASRVIVIRGGVDVALADSTEPGSGPFYDGVFIGRLHVQKGVRQLIDIWSRMQLLRPGSRLAIIGDGPLLADLVEMRDRANLTDLIDFHGFLDGREKFRIVKRSRVVVHPSLYDSGGMAACEAFACGLPGVCFDIPELVTYYPQGMKKVPAYDLDGFADAILSLLDDSPDRLQLSLQARQLAEQWDWDNRCAEIGREINRALAKSSR